jgi:tetratricopeptide (TPR) repeat protein
MPGGTPQTTTGSSSNSGQHAFAAYNSGVEHMKQADEADAEAAKASDPEQQKKAAKHAHNMYVEARKDYEESVRADPSHPEVWNNLGYTYRKLGTYDAALKAYDRALALHPGYPEALEYRGEAYLGLNRIEDAKKVYMDLFASNRTISDTLLTAIKTWIGERRKAGTPDASTLDEFDKWAQERTQIAAQTAALTRPGRAASWN